jgi:hypothetical protein
LIKVCYDSTIGIITSQSSEFLTVEEVHRFFDDLRVAIDRSRQDWQGVRLFIDATKTLVASADVMREFLAGDHLLTGERDRMAVVVSGGLNKLQAARGMRSEREKTFLSTEEAMAWLMAVPHRGRQSK